ncbi:hypothetical protein JTE90_004000 [Oedothorax gibbosus]|uniref:Uncharacterized protein n=1 Tax=Oedothorax gibbosus TaxID=931172 RepID=A0AAV6UDB8_9ARAC|nr:hypothetical protein JTE90_004000 [Oedothorax gibbosus]
MAKLTKEVHTKNLSGHSRNRCLTTDLQQKADCFCWSHWSKTSGGEGMPPPFTVQIETLKVRNCWDVREENNFFLDACYLG